MFYLTIATIIKVIDNYFLERFLLLKSKLVCKSLAKTPAMAEVRMKSPPKGIRSKRTIPEDRVTYAIPIIEDPASHLILIEYLVPH